MVETLKQTVDRLADELVSFTRDAGHAGNYKRAMQEAIRAALAEPTEAMKDRAVAFALNVTVQGCGGWTKYTSQMWNVQAAERLKELE